MSDATWREAFMAALSGGHSAQMAKTQADVAVQLIAERGLAAEDADAKGDALPDGWTWSQDGSMAIGPAGRHKQSVWVHSKHNKPPHVEFSIGMDSAPVAVVEAVLRRHAENKGE